MVSIKCMRCGEVVHTEDINDFKPCKCVRKQEPKDDSGRPTGVIELHHAVFTVDKEK